MFNKMFAFAALLSLSFAAFAENISPVAAPQAVVTEGNARFTVLTDRLIRMEWSEDGVFEDNATLAIVNRDLPVPAFTVSRKGGVLTVRTDKVTLTYKGGRFDADNLKVSFMMGRRAVTWNPGADDSGNLLGTTRTLDGCKGFRVLSKSEKELEKGILSRDGWAIVDESDRHLLVKDDSDWGCWVKERPEGDRLDLYIFAYGHDYKAALSDFTKVAGKIPLPPKYAFGYWWSRYWIYTDEEILAIGRDMKEHDIPMDVFIIDMDWHMTWKPMEARIGKDEFGQRRGWTGYTWNRDLFPDPEGTLNELHDMGFKTSLNLHPASGIRPYEDCYRSFVKDYLSRTSDYDGPENFVYGDAKYTFAGTENAVGKKGSPAPVPFRLSQKEWADAYFNSVIHPLEEQGVDFWWLDWQQWKQSRYVKDLSNTFWCNFTFFNDKVRQNAGRGADADRAMIYHRWGGLGSHRYQLGFSGDTYDEWDVLSFLPYFTATASNVGYGYWGHDIGGHMQSKDHQRPTEGEMFTRWLQYGVFTPIFKTHSTQSANLERRIWMFPEHYEYMRDAIMLRYRLSPYIYDAARQCYDTGVSICRPMYYDYPEDERAYSMNQEFFFGDNILATVIDHPVDAATGKAGRKMWFPAGSDWYDMAEHVMRRGGTEQTLSYSIAQNPWFVRAASVIPMAEDGLTNLQTVSDRLTLLVAPGAGRSTYTHYEDDGRSQHYVDDYATTVITNAATSKKNTITIFPRQGSYAGAPLTRTLNLVLEGFIKMPSSVRVNGSPAECRKEGSSLLIELEPAPADGKIVVEVNR